MAYIEVPFNNHDSQPYRSFNLRNDSSARTLQDLKFPDRGGGFGYVSGNEMSSAVRNRFIYWRYSNGSLEILEDSLDTTLRSGWLKFIFSNTCVLHAEAFERPDGVEMLVCTADSAVRLLFPHPASTVKEGSVGACRTAPSIFHEVETPRQHVVPLRALNQPGQLRCATAHVRRSDGAALFAFCLTTGSVMLVEMPPVQDALRAGGDPVEGAKIVELRQASMMSKLWSGIVPSFASRNDQVSPDTATDALFLDEGRPTLLLTVNRDHKLRLWNVENRDLAVVTDLLECLEDKVDTRSLQIKSQGHSLRRSHAGKQGTSVGVHLNFVNRSYFIIFAVNDRAEDIHSCLVPVRRILCDARQDIVDWIVVPTAQLVWLLMQSEDGYSLSSHNLREPGGAFGAVLPALFLSDVLWGEEEESELSLVSVHQDPQEACLDAVFAPGRFSTLAISRAITALRQSCESLSPSRRASQPTGSLDAMKEDVIALVESKIADSLAEMSAAHELSRMDEAEATESSEVQLRMMHWSHFYASVLDYQRTCVSRPVGLVVDHNTGLLGVVRKAGLSLFRLAEPVEMCAFLPLPLLTRHALAAVSDRPGQESHTSALLLLLRHCRYLQHCVGAGALSHLYAQLELATEEPSGLAAAVLSECLRQEHEREIGQRLSAADQLLEAFLRLVEIAEDLNDAEEMSDDSEAEERIVATFSHPERFLFASPLGVESVARSVDCILTARLRLATSLLLVQQLLTSPGGRASAHTWLSEELSARLSGPVRIRLVNLIRNLALMRWLSSVRLVPPAAHVLDRVAPQLALVGSSGVDARTTPLSAADCRRTLLELFFEDCAGETVRRRLRETGLLDVSPTEPAQRLWAAIFPLAASFLQASVCPSSSALVLGLCQFLLSRGQNQVLLKMTRLLDGWWQIDPVLVLHVRGLALLNCGQPQKALYNIVKALKQLTANWDTDNASCVPAAVLGAAASMKPLPLVQVNIALTVMRVLEIMEEPLLVVELAHHALQWLKLSPTSSHSSDAHASDAVSLEEDGGSEERRMEEADVEEELQLRGVLWTSVFKHELATGRNDKAFEALLSNPDRSGQRDCLRQLIVTLCDRGELQTLVGLPLGELEEEFVAILESRARAVDLHVYNYYDLLYAFHVTRASYRAAAGVMYEQAWRVGAEVRSLAGLQKQARAFLSCLTALRLVHPGHRWLVPARGPTEGLGDCGPEAVELADVEREYILVKARLRVAEMDIDHSLLSAGRLSVADTTRCLLKVGLYNVAVQICRLFEQPLDPVFEALAARCVSLPQAAPGSHGPRDLQLEKAVLVECLEEVDSGPGYEGLPATQLAWTLLRTYLDAHGDGKYWRCAVAKLLASRHMPPAWLAAEGKRRNPGSLLRLYIQHDEVEAAATLAMDCIDDAAAKGGGPSVAVSAQRWLPHMWIQQLLAGLDILAKSNAQCGMMRDKLQAKLSNYLDLLRQAARDRAMLRVSRGAKLHLQND